MRIQRGAMIAREHGHDLEPERLPRVQRRRHHAEDRPARQAACPSAAGSSPRRASAPSTPRPSARCIPPSAGAGGSRVASESPLSSAGRRSHGPAAPTSARKRQAHARARCMCEIAHPSAIVTASATFVVQAITSPVEAIRRMHRPRRGIPFVVGVAKPQSQQHVPRGGVVGVVAGEQTTSRERAEANLTVALAGLAGQATAPERCEVESQLMHSLSARPEPATADVRPVVAEKHRPVLRPVRAGPDRSPRPGARRSPAG